MEESRFYIFTKQFAKSERGIVWAILAVGIVLAGILFSYAMSIPIESRVRGDAFEYMSIADGFSSWGDAFDYIGNRTYGFPLFLYAVKLATSSSTVAEWAVATSYCLFPLHLCACLFFYAAFLKVSFKKAGLPVLAAPAVTAALMAYPALVTYTSVPLTDTFCVDLLMLAIAACSVSVREARPVAAFSLLGCAGLLLGYSVLVRPSFGFPLAAFYIVALCGAIISPERRAQIIRTAVMLAASLVLILPTMGHIWETQHSIGLQDKSFIPKYIPTSMQSGLSSVRVYWSNKYVSQEPIPGVKDPYLNEIYGACKVDSATSLAKCLLAEPQGIPFYFGKKAIALFDEPHLQPYAVDLTPDWFAPLERIFETAAFCGFIAMLILAGTHLRRVKPVWIGLPWMIFVLALMSLHSLLHIEGRYGFPLIPFSLASLLLGFAQARQAGRKFLVWWFLAIGAAGACFLFQIYSWDFVLPS